MAQWWLLSVVTFSILYAILSIATLLVHVLIVHMFAHTYVLDIIYIAEYYSNSRIRFGMQIVFVSLNITPSHYHFCVNWSEYTDLISYLSDIFCRVCEYDWAYSLNYPLYSMCGCLFSVYLFPLWWLREYNTLSYYHHQIGSMNYHSLLRVRSRNNGIRCVSILLFRVYKWTCAYICVNLRYA